MATLPLVGGEAAVLRVLDKEGGDRRPRPPRLRPRRRGRSFERAFSKPHGAILVTGPTGSGKTTTLYGALQVLHTPEKNIITIEDPVEYELTGIKQMQVNPKAGVTFAGGLRSMLRADPDVIMVGEIRDRETAQIAVEAALTGHLVLSTLHTNDAPTAIARLIDMGVEPFLVASAVDCVVAQRLARMLLHPVPQARCASPARSCAPTASTPTSRRSTPSSRCGCSRCGGTGYKGRIGLYEVMPVDQELRQLAVARAASDEIAALAVAKGMVRLREDGMAKAMQGLTSFAEVARVTA